MVYWMVLKMAVWMEQLMVDPMVGWMVLQMVDWMVG
jgi:hypothetical protein